MRLEWIEDILAVLDTGSLARAAERRLLTQSAFTRRVRMIEQSIGATLFDRRRKPIRLMPGVEALEPELRDLAASLRRLATTLRLSADGTRGPLTFVCQHAITTTVSPRVVSALAHVGETSVRVRSGNRDDCLMRLLSREADFAIMFEVPGARAPAIPKAFAAVTLGTDRLIPVATPAVRAQAKGPEIPTVSYPPEVFLGQVFDRMIAPRLPDGMTTLSRAETALTLAMLEFALEEIGVAWLPQSLVAEHLARGRLIRLDDLLPAQALDITMIRLSEERSERRETVWRHVLDNVRLAGELQSLPDGAAGPVEPLQRAEE